jgi:hypothetical protein
MKVLVECEAVFDQAFLAGPSRARRMPRVLSEHQAKAAGGKDRAKMCSIGRDAPVSMKPDRGTADRSRIGLEYERIKGC